MLSPHRRSLILVLCLLVLLPGLQVRARASNTLTNKVGLEFESAMTTINAVHLAQLHPGWVRLHIKWNLVETAPGEYDWDSTESERVERILRGVQRVGAVPILTIKLAPAFYRTLPDLCSRPDGEGGAAALGRFILALSARYTGLKHFEIWNEPDVPTGIENQEYLGCFIEEDGAAAAGQYYGTLVKETAAVVNAQDPEIKLIGPALLGSLEFLNHALAAGGASFDLVSVHHYQAYQSTQGKQYDIQRLEDLYGGIRHFMQLHNMSAPILISETSLRCALAEAWTGTTHRCREYPDFYQQQGEWLEALDAWAQSKADVPAYIWYTAQSNGWDDTDLVHRNYRKKPVFIQFMRLTRPFRAIEHSPYFPLPSLKMR